MIRKIVFLALIGVAFFACKDDDNVGFDVATEFQDLEFKPVPGGAVMSYTLPKNLDIFGVRVRYTDAWGEQQMRDGSYLADTLLLDGFTEAQSGVSAQICFFDHNMMESAPMDVTFATEKAATVAVFDNLAVNPFWGGFNVTYTAPEEVNGIIHVFYIGTNPLTHEPDSILLTSVPITEGGDTLNFVPQQGMDSYDVVVRTDDYKGKRIKQAVFADVPSLSMDTLAPADFTFDLTGTIVDEPDYELGIQYATDGDKNGLGFRANKRDGENFKYATFMAGPNAFYDEEIPNFDPSENRFIIELKDPKCPAAVNLYAYIWFGGNSYDSNDAFVMNIWSSFYQTRLPAIVKVYGTNEDPRTVDLESCALLNDFEDDVSYDGFQDSWANRTDVRTSANFEIWGSQINYGGNYVNTTEEEARNAEPVVLNLLLNYTGEPYKYIIFIVEDTYCSNRWNEDAWEENSNGYVTFNEVEVCVQAD